MPAPLSIHLAAPSRPFPGRTRGTHLHEGCQMQTDNLSCSYDRWPEPGSGPIPPARLHCAVPLAGPIGGYGQFQLCPITKMPTPKGEHFVSPCSTRGDVRWENHFRRNRNPPKTLVVGSYFLPASESRRNPTHFLEPLSCSYAPTCSNRRNVTAVAEQRKRPRNSLRISVQYEHIKHFTKSRYSSFEVQSDHRLRLPAVAKRPHQHPEPAKSKAGKRRKHEQYPNEFKNT